jgi:hypothetical protein
MNRPDNRPISDLIFFEKEMGEGETIVHGISCPGKK